MAGGYNLDAMGVPLSTRAAESVKAAFAAAASGDTAQPVGNDAPVSTDPTRRPRVGFDSGKSLVSGPTPTAASASAATTASDSFANGLLAGTGLTTATNTVQPGTGPLRYHPAATLAAIQANSDPAATAAANAPLPVPKALDPDAIKRKLRPGA